MMDNVPADARATEAVNRSARGQRVAVPLPLQPTYGAHPMSRRVPDMEWRIHEPQKWRPPPNLHPRMEQLLRESPETGIQLLPMHLGMWHPILKVCPHCEDHKEVTTRLGACATSPDGARPLHAVEPLWRLHRGASLRIISGVLRLRSCIAAEGKGTHNWAAVPRDQVHPLAAMQVIEFRHWATIVRSFVADT